MDDHGEGETEEAGGRDSKTSKVDHEPDVEKHTGQEEQDAMVDEQEEDGQPEFDPTSEVSRLTRIKGPLTGCSSVPTAADSS